MNAFFPAFFAIFAACTNQMHDASVQFIAPDGSALHLAAWSSARARNSQDVPPASSGEISIAIRDDGPTVIRPFVVRPADNATTAERQDAMNSFRNTLNSWWGPSYVVVQPDARTVRYPISQAIHVSGRVPGKSATVNVRDSWNLTATTADDGRFTVGGVKRGEAAQLIIAVNRLHFRVKLDANQTASDFDLGDIAVPSVAMDSHATVVLGHDVSKMDARDNVLVEGAVLIPVQPNGWYVDGVPVPEFDGATGKKTGRTVVRRKVAAGDYWVCVAGERVLNAVLDAWESGVDLSSWELPKITASATQSAEVTIDADTVYHGMLRHTGLALLPSCAEEQEPALP